MFTHEAAVVYESFQLSHVILESSNVTDMDLLSLEVLL